MKNLILFYSSLSFFLVNAKEDHIVERMYAHGLLTSEEVNAYKTQIDDFLQAAYEKCDIYTASFPSEIIEEYQRLAKELGDKTLKVHTF
ncbi:MAG: hypothetical protein K0M45_02610 [Candidatus Paracaedibacteraceae bacterium]|nr:hypothetical protein [Candidatus Paracaedibacteraceae bacterium]